MVNKFLKWLGFSVKIKRNPKTSITLQEFYDAVGEVAKEKNQTFFHVGLQKGSHTMNPYGPLRLTGYIHGANHMEGLTIEEVCDKLRNYRQAPEPSSIKEVTFEL